MGILCPKRAVQEVFHRTFADALTAFSQITANWHHSIHYEERGIYVRQKAVHARGIRTAAKEIS